MHDEIAVLNFEIQALQRHHPARILNYIIRDLPEGRYRRGYKSPNDVEDGRARNKLAIHYPKTKLLVGLRHPVLWYESFYNHRVQNGYDMPDLAAAIVAAEAEDTISGIRDVCQGGFNGVCFPRANFHTILARWGKTPLLSLPSTSSSSTIGENDNTNENENTNENSHANYYHTNKKYNNEDEWQLFSKKDQRSLRNEVNKTNISPNLTFLNDVSQLRMPTSSSSRSISDNGNEVIDNANDNGHEAKYYNEFVLSLQSFLGVPKNVESMPPMIRESPGKKDGINATEQLRRNKLKIDLCSDDEKYLVPRQWLLESGSNIHLWITNYFVKSPHNVFFGGGGDGDGDDSSSSSSSSSQFLKLIESYGKDPCPERRRKRKEQQ